MNFSDTLVEKLDKLIEELNQILSRGKLEPAIKFKDLGYYTQKRVTPNPEPEYTGRVIIENAEDVYSFAISSLSILKEYIGESSVPYLEFKRQWESISSANTIDHQDLRKLKGPLESAKKELLEGFLPPYELRVASEVYGDLLETAITLFEKGNDRAATILAGAVLEDGLKKFAKQNKIKLTGKNTIGPIAEDLARPENEAISPLEQNDIIGWARVYNDAKHDLEAFKKHKKKEVKKVLDGVQEFLKKRLS